MTTPATLYAYDIAADGTATALDAPDASPTRGRAYRWLHFDLNADGVADWIAETVDPIVAEALIREDTRPRCTPHEKGLIVILRGVNLNPESEPEDMVSIRLWVQDDLVISTRIRKLMAVTALNTQMEAGNAPVSPGAFVAQLGAGLTDRMDPVVSDLSDRIDELEEVSVDQTTGLRGQIADIRRTTIALRRYVAPQKDALWRLATGGFSQIDAAAQGRLRETGDQVLRLVEELDAVRDRSAILNDQLTDKRAEEMNTTMLVLSVVAAIFLPLGFLTGLLGINVGGMPGADWSLAFWIVCAACLGIAGALVWMFKRRGWI